MSHSSSWSLFTNYSWIKSLWFVFQVPGVQMKRNGLQLISVTFLHSAFLSVRGHGGPLHWLPRQLLGSVAHRLWEAKSHWVRDFDYQLADPGNFHFHQFFPDRIVFSGEFRHPCTTGVILQCYIRGRKDLVPVSHLRGSLLGCGPSCGVCQVSRITGSVAWPPLTGWTGIDHICILLSGGVSCCAALHCQLVDSPLPCFPENEIRYIDLQTTTRAYMYVQRSSF